MSFVGDIRILGVLHLDLILRHPLLHSFYEEAPPNYCHNFFLVSSQNTDIKEAIQLIIFLTSSLNSCAIFCYPVPLTYIILAPQ